MALKTFKLLEVRSREEWRNWLAGHYNLEKELWLVFRKGAAANPLFKYRDALEEALCFGWIDSIVKRLDDVRYARKFTPRKPGSQWSTINRRLHKDLKSRGLLAAPGLERAPIGRNRNAPRPSLTKLPAYIENGLEARPRIWKAFESLAPSLRRAYIGWIDSAKKDETKQRRLRETIRLLETGKRLPMK